MKTKFYFLSALAGVFFLASCGGGISDGTKSALAKLDSAWGEAGKSAMAWGDSLTAAITWCENACKDGDAMECCEHMKGKKDSLMGPCKNDLTAFQDMKTKWDAEMPKWDSLEAKLTAAKDKVAKNEGTDAEINAVITELQAAMDAGAAEMQTWVTNFNAAKTTCMNNMQACKTGWESAKCEDKKSAMHKKGS